MIRLLVVAQQAQTNVEKESFKNNNRRNVDANFINLLSYIVNINIKMKKNNRINKMRRTNYI